MIFDSINCYVEYICVKALIEEAMRMLDDDVIADSLNKTITQKLIISKLLDSEKW